MKYLFFYTNKHGKSRVIDNSNVNRKYEDLKLEKPCIFKALKLIVNLSPTKSKEMVKFEVLRFFKIWKTNKIEELSEEDKSNEKLLNK